MNEPMLPIPALTFSYREDELGTILILSVRRILRRVGSRRLIECCKGGAIALIIALTVIAADITGRIPHYMFGSIYFSVFGVFLAGFLTHLWLAFFRQRRIRRFMVHEASHRTSKGWRATFTDAGFVWSGDLYENRITWRAVESVETLNGLVVIWIVGMQNFCIPARVFADDVARDAFVGAVKARIAATQNPVPVKSEAELVTV